MNLPLARDGGQRRGRDGRPVEAKYNAVGVDSPHAGINRAGQQLRHREVQSAFRGLGEGGAFGLANRELDPALPVFWQLHRGRSHRRNCANANGHLHRDLRIVPILHWADQFPTRDSEVLCGARSVPGREEGMMEILLVVWFGWFRGLAGE